jgi:hypothetical protein
MSEGFTSPEWRSEHDLFNPALQAPVGTLDDIREAIGDRDSVIDDDPEGELQVPLASQEVELERALLKQQALEALNA